MEFFLAHFQSKPDKMNLEDNMSRNIKSSQIHIISKGIFL